jgi:hypothetical protein
MDGARRKLLFSKFKRCAHAVLFIIYLRRFCQRTRTGRKTAFDKYYVDIDKNLNSVRTVIKKALNKPISQITNNEDTDLKIAEDDSAEAVEQKVAAVRRLAGLFLKSLGETIWTNRNSNFVISSLYFLCKHGNHSTQAPLLTKQELSLCCISPFGNISAEANLEKVAIANLLIIKLLLFNILLSKNHQGNINRSLWVVGSVLYELVTSVQKECLRRVPDSYEVGNYKSQHQKVRGL